MREMGGGYRYDTAPKRMTFNMTPFNTFKSMKNIYGNHINEIRDRVKLFIESPEWYAHRGIPHTLGILLHGNPGCGKTSLIKAIAKDTNRHVFNLTIRKSTTQRQLMNLFFEENVNVTNSANEASVISIPLDQRIYVIEDIDCLTDVVLDRTYLEMIKMRNCDKLQEYIDSDLYEGGINSDSQNIVDGLLNTTYEELDEQQNCNIYQNTGNMSYQQLLNGTDFSLSNTQQNNTNDAAKKVQKPKQNQEEITLSFLLNLLDGVLETPGRILIMTSNYPKRLDKALIRPGRVDINIKFTNAAIEMIREMFANFYNLKTNLTDCLNINPKLNLRFSPAKIIAILCNNYVKYEAALAELNSLV